MAQRPANLAEFDRYVAHATRVWRVPGLAIAVVKNDSLVFAKGYGVLELGKRPPVTEHTRFAIGSTTKAITAAALAMLVDEGKLQWEDRVIDHIPEFRLYDPYVTRELTIRDLLTHRSGLPNTDLLWFYGSHTFPELMRRLRYVRPATSFRSEFEYQNVMYAAAGAVVARVSGMSWDSFVRTRIFAPLGMSETVPLVSEIAGRANVAAPHAVFADTVRVVPIRSTDAVAPAGSVWSSVADMSKWMRFILDSGRVGNARLITSRNFIELVAPQIRATLDESEFPGLALAPPHFFNYALGWWEEDYRGEMVWMHIGNIDGMSAIIGLLPERRLGVYVLTNLAHTELRQALMYEVFDRFTGKPSRDWSAELQTLAARVAAREPTPRPYQTGVPPSLPLDRYVGTYADSANGVVEVSLTDASLHLRFDGTSLGALEPFDYDTFRTRTPTVWEGRASLVTFLTNGAAQVNAVQMFGASFVRAEQARPRN